MYVIIFEEKIKNIVDSDNIEVVEIVYKPFDVIIEVPESFDGKTGESIYLFNPETMERLPHEENN